MNAQLSFDTLSPYQLPVNRRRICDFPPDEQPKYRLWRHGSQTMTTTELLALILGTPDAPGLSADLLQKFGSLYAIARANKAQLMAIKGIGETQAARLQATAELSRRLQRPPAQEKTKVNSPADAAALLMPLMRHLEQEEVWVILTDTRTRVTAVRQIYKGTLNSANVRPAEIFRPAIEANAAAIIAAHNHPSGQPSPSPEDASITRTLRDAGKLLEIELLDHLIIGDGVYLSMKERNLGFD